VYKIADGYYMYRKRFSVVAEPKASAILGRPTFGKGEMKQDATFGKVEVFRDSVRILIPVASIGSGSNMVAEKFLRLKVTSQGCADAGICYPPLHQTITLVSGSHDVKYPDTALGFGGITQPPQSKAGSTEHSLSELLRKAK
jgi:thiol:disulfide interchange protein DsbD